jgi:NADH dehydrogenase
MVVLVLGGNGFIGRHVVDALTARGHDVIVGTRLKTLDGSRTRQANFESLTRPAHWYPLLRGIDTVVNTVGILRERNRETYDLVHHRAPAALARACAYCGLRLVHVSALGLRDTARSGFILSKLAGERAISASGSDHSIVRPSLVDGEGGFGARWIRWFARWPVHFLPANARGRIAALDARDLGEAIAVLCESAATPELREVELGGIDWRTMGAYLSAMRPTSLFRAFIVPVPSWMARALSHLCDLAHFSPFSFGHFELLQHDNVPRENLLPALLGRSPKPVGRPGTGPETRPYEAGQVIPTTRTGASTT